MCERNMDGTGNAGKPDPEVVTHNALGHVLDHPHVKVKHQIMFFADSEILLRH